MLYCYLLKNKRKTSNYSVIAWWTFRIKKTKFYLKKKGACYFKYASRGLAHAWKPTIRRYKSQFSSNQQTHAILWPNWQRIQDNYHKETQRVIGKLRKAVQWAQKLISRRNTLLKSIEIIKKIKFWRWKTQREEDYIKSNGNRTDHMEERISELDDGNFEMIQVEEKGEFQWKNSLKTIQFY